MYYIYREYGQFIEITQAEKQSSKVRVSFARSRGDVYGARRSDNVYRTRKICVRRLSAAFKEFGRPLLLTLTFAGDSSDAAYAGDSLRRFQVRLRVAYPGCQSLFVPELSPRGRIHFHGLLFAVPLSCGDQKKGRRVVSYGSERSTRQFASLWGQGFVDVLQTNGSVRLAYYLSKYVTKAAGHVIFNAMHLIRISQGFPREVVVRGDVAEWLAIRCQETKKLLREWRGSSVFTGEISKKYY